VQVFARQAGQVAERVVAIVVGVVRRVGMVDLDDGLQLVGGVVSELARLRRVCRNVKADGAGLERLVGVEEEAGQGAYGICDALRVVLAS
jgi:hypothetical protein